MIVPAKARSKRLNNKNFRQMKNGESLVDIKIKQAKRSDANIILATDHEQGQDIARRYGVKYAKLDGDKLDGFANWPDSYCYTVDRCMEVACDDEICWAQVTDPAFDSFQRSFESWENNKKHHDSQIMVRPFGDWLVDEHGMPVNFRYGHWHFVSTDLPNHYRLSYGCNIIKRDAYMRVKYPIGTSPCIYVENKTPHIDIDYIDDFLLAEKIVA